MTNQELIEFNKNRNIFQLCILTRDVDRSMKEWLDKFGVGPWQVLTFSDKTVKGLHVDGQLVTEPFKFLIAISRIGNLEIEIIQPVYGPMIYEEYLNRKGEGLHHIKEKISDEDMDRVVADYAQKGIKVLQTGWFQNDVHFYLDTEKSLGFPLELGNCPEYMDLPAEIVRTWPEE